MSETDSDLDFESADEEVEITTDSKCKTFPRECVKEIPSDNTLSSEITGITDDVTTLINKSAENIAEESNANNSVDYPTQVSDHYSCTEVSNTMGISTKKNHNYLKSESTDKKPTNANEKDVTSDICAKIEYTSTTKDSPVTKSDHKVESESHDEKQRVVLRLEKKIQQKSQFPKAVPVQKEKASDLVNILREESSEKQFSSWGFSSWGTGLLSSAASSVSTFSSQVSQGIGTVFETVESSLGAPTPEELATALNEKKKERDDDSSVKSESETDTQTSVLPNVSSWTKVFENTGSKVLMGGLDTLELIGKKTMDMLTEGDPGLRKKRAVFSDRVNISEILREAKAKADEQDQKDGLEGNDSIHYSQIFDEKQGLVQLEALEMLSKQCQSQLQRLIMRYSKNIEIMKQIEEIKSICENIPSLDDPSDCDNFEDFETVFRKYTLELSLPLNVENIMQAQRQINDAINKFENVSEEPHYSSKEIFCSAICSLAEFTAKCIETFHKVAELILVQSRLDPDAEHYATNLTGLTTVMCIEINNMSARYHRCLDRAAEYIQSNPSSEDLNVTTMATNLYVEAANSNKYIQDAYQMLVPVLQVCLLEALD